MFTNVLVGVFLVGVVNISLAIVFASGFGFRVHLANLALIISCLAAGTT